MAWKKGLYKLTNPEKYLGDPNNIIYRSSWEEHAFKICDNNPNVLEWAAEFIVVPYFVPNIKNPTGNPIKRRYIPDLYLVVRESNNVIRKKIIEIKPHKQSQQSKSRNPRTRLYEDYTFAINQLKWEAAKNYCAKRNIEFIVTTERELFGNRTKR